MVTRTELLDDVGSSDALPGHFAPGAYVVTQKVDFSKLDSGAGVDSGDVVEAIQVPKNTLVLGVHAEVLTGEEADAGELDDVDIGDGGDADGYHDGLNLTAAFSAYVGVGDGFDATVDAGSTSATEPVVVTGYSAGKFYAAADTIDVKVNTVGNDQNAGILRLRAVMVPLLAPTH